MDTLRKFKFHLLASALLIALAAIIACSPAAEATPTAEASPTQSPATSTPAPAPLTESAVRNASYNMPDLGIIQLTDGEYEDQYGEGACEVNRVGIISATLGDLNGDNLDDAAVILWEDTGGSGTFIYLAVTVNDGGTPAQAGITMIGDRAQIEAVAIEAGIVTVQMVTHGPDDPMCCPSQRATQTYQLQGGELMLLAVDVHPTPTPDTPPALTLEAIQNAAYSSEWPADGIAKLTDGIYREKYDENSASEMVIALNPDEYAIGDLNGDGTEDAAVILATSGGGSGTFMSLEVLSNDDGTPNHIATAFLGDRAQIESVKVEAGVITVQMVTHGPDDPMCCPTLEVTQSYELQGEELVQLVNEAELAAQATGIYKAYEIAASSPGIDSTFYLNADQTVRIIDDYLGGEPPIVEIGSWEIDSTGQIVATITGQEDRPYTTPDTIILTLDDGILESTPDNERYGTFGRIWYGLDALIMGEQSLPYDNFTAAQNVNKGTYGFAGIYKGFHSSASCCGRDYTLFLNIDNSAELRTNYHNGEPAIIEVGTWEDSDDDRLTLTLTGTTERNYETSDVLTFALEEGLLTAVEYNTDHYGAEGLTFYYGRALQVAQSLRYAGDEIASYYLTVSLEQYPGEIGLWEVEAIESRLHALLGEQHDTFIQNMQTQEPVAREQDVFYVLGHSDAGQAIFLYDEANNHMAVKLLDNERMTEYNEGGQEIQSLPTDVATIMANWHEAHGQ